MFRNTFVCESSSVSHHLLLLQQAGYIVDESKDHPSVKGQAVIYAHLPIEDDVLEETQPIIPVQPLAAFDCPRCEDRGYIYVTTHRGEYDESACPTCGRSQGLW